MNRLACAALLVSWALSGRAPTQQPAAIVLKPARVFDGVAAEPHADWVVVVRGQRIESAGPANEIKMPDNARVIDLPNMTLLPGLIEAHSHLLLHPYNEAAWADQVLKEPLTVRVVRATNHARSTLMA